MEAPCACAISRPGIRSWATSLGASSQAILIARPIIIHRSQCQPHGPEAPFASQSSRDPSATKITIPFENKAASPVLGAMHQGRDGNRFLGAREEMGAIRRMRGVGKAAAGRNSGGASLRSCEEGAGASRPKRGRKRSRCHRSELPGRPSPAFLVKKMIEMSAYLGSWSGRRQSR